MTLGRWHEEVDLLREATASACPDGVTSVTVTFQRGQVIVVDVAAFPTAGGTRHLAERLYHFQHGGADENTLVAMAARAARLRVEAGDWRVIA